MGRPITTRPKRFSGGRDKPSGDARNQQVRPPLMPVPGSNRGRQTRVFRACPAPDRRLLGGSPWIDSGSAGKLNSAVDGRKNRSSRFSRTSVSKTSASSGICESMSCFCGGNNSGISAELTAELQRNISGLNRDNSGIDSRGEFRANPLQRSKMPFRSG